ncbi:MAG: xylulokinase [Fimbriiglobus sp.]
MSILSESSLFVGWDFSTGSVKALAVDLHGNIVADVRLPTDIWSDEQGVRELNLMMLEGQARAITRALVGELKKLGRLQDWVAGGISATHHTSGRIDAHGNQVRRAICWNDQTLANFHADGLRRLGGPERVQELIGAPWAVRYSLSHLVKDEVTLKGKDWRRTKYIQAHGSLAAGYLTGRFDCISISAAASTGLMDFRTATWQPKMLEALAFTENQSLAEATMPTIIPMDQPIGPISETVAVDVGLPTGFRPLVYPTLDDQAAGLVGGGAVHAGHVAIILGNSAVVNSSSAMLPSSGSLDAMRLNWGPYLWMRCYSNGAQFIDRVVGENPDWDALEASATATPLGCDGVSVSPFVLSEPSLGITEPKFGWSPAEPQSPGVRFRAALESLAYLIALGVKEHEAAGQKIERITISGGTSRSLLMCEILASVLNRPLQRLVSDEGPALGGAIAAMAGYTSQHDPKTSHADHVEAAVQKLVKFRGAVNPRPEWVAGYAEELAKFATRISS